MAIEALKPTPENLFQHHAGHDLECLLNTMLTVCHYTVGPSGKLRQATCEADKKIPLNKWFVQDDRFELACQKMVILETPLLLIEPYLPPYWADFAPYLQRLIKATYSEMPYLTADNIATHKAYREILQEALEKYELEEGEKYAVYASVPRPSPKRQREEPSTNTTKRRRRTDDPVQPQQIVLHPLELHFLESFDKFGGSRAEHTPSPGAESQDGYLQGGTDMEN